MSMIYTNKETERIAELNNELAKAIEENLEAKELLQRLSRDTKRIIVISDRKHSCWDDCKLTLQSIEYFLKRGINNESN